MVIAIPSYSINNLLRQTLLLLLFMHDEVSMGSESTKWLEKEESGGEEE